MKARSVSRELALMTLFQVPAQADKFTSDKLSLNDLVLNTVRSLKALASEQIQDVSEEIERLRLSMVDHEMDHPVNENIPVDEPTLPVPIPTTHEMAAKLEKLLLGVQNLEDALFLPELETLSHREDVQNYSLMLLRAVMNNSPGIDLKIEKVSTDWKVERIQKMDLMILRLAIAELDQSKGVDPATVVDEYLELARRFTSEESRKFIHGILGAITASSSPEPSPVLAEATENV